MLIDRTLPNFEPSSSVITAMTYVRRRAISGSIDVWGLFDEHKVGVDQALFWIAVMLEIIGVLMIARYMPPPYAFGLAIAALFIDVLLAYGHHRFSCTRVLHVRRFVADFHAEYSGGASLGNSLKQKIGARKVVGYLFAIALVIMTALKAGAFFIVNGRQINTMLLGMVAVYVTICLIHIFVSGYAMAYIRAAGWFGLWGFGAEVKRFNDQPDGSDLQAQERNQSVLGDQAFKELLAKEVASGNTATALKPNHEYCVVRQLHAIRSTNDGMGLEIKACGVLYNDDIREMMRHFRKMPAIQEIAQAALHLQAYQIITED